MLDLLTGLLVSLVEIVTEDSECVAGVDVSCCDNEVLSKLLVGVTRCVVLFTDCPFVVWVETDWLVGMTWLDEE